MPPVRFDPRPRGDAPGWYPVLVVLCAVFAIAPLTYPGSFQTHTGMNAVYNLMDLHARLGTIGWAPTFGRGFDLLRGDGVLPYALAESLHLVGLPFLTSIKVTYAFAFLLSGIGMFLLARRVFKSDAAGLLSALVYIYFPYHLALVYVRGAFGEAAVWASLPLALWALVVLIQRSAPAWPDYMPAVLAFALLVLAQPGLALALTLVALMASVILIGWKRALRGGYAAGAGALLGLLLLLPGAWQNQATGSSIQFVPAFPDLFQFLTASWGAALPKGNYLEQFPYQIGIAALGLALLALAFLSKTDTRMRRLTFFAAGGSAVTLLLMLPPAAPLWNLTGATHLVEYPFELLVLIGAALALAAGSILVSDMRFAQTPMLAILAVIPILAVYAYLAPEYLDFAPTHPPLARFNDNEIALLDATVVRPPGTFRHGATVELDLQWQALREVNHDYTVFVHVVDANGKQWGGEDIKPQAGALPTIQWPVGRVISDTHTVQIDLAGPPEGYHLEVGLYTAFNGKRAATETGATEVEIDENHK